MKTIAISQSNYIPWKGYFDMINSVDEFIIYDEMQFTKRDWRNRNQIKTPNGLLWLTIPVKVKGKFFQKICETEVEGSDWAEKHWKTIKMNYAKCPFFDLYSNEFEKTYEEASKTIYLSEVNFLFLNKICSLMDISTPLLSSSEMEIVDGKTERLVSLCQQAEATTYVSGPAAKDYLDESLFHQAGMDVKWMNYSNYEAYPQRFGEFYHGVSVLDLLFNVGPDYKRFLKSFTGAVIHD
jgi:hypothetical protein